MVRWIASLAKLDGYEAGEGVERRGTSTQRSVSSRSTVVRSGRPNDAALNGLARIRTGRSLPIPLAWTSGPTSGVFAIEVYPAATLKAHGLPFQGYKESVAGRDVRAGTARQLEGVTMSLGLQAVCRGQRGRLGCGHLRPRCWGLCARRSQAAGRPPSCP